MRRLDAIAAKVEMQQPDADYKLLQTANHVATCTAVPPRMVSVRVANFFWVPQQKELQFTVPLKQGETFEQLLWRIKKILLEEKRFLPFWDQLKDYSCLTNSKGDYYMNSLAVLDCWEKDWLIILDKDQSNELISPKVEKEEEEEEEEEQLPNVAQVSTTYHIFFLWCNAHKGESNSYFWSGGAHSFHQQNNSCQQPNQTMYQM